jgi:hypothetical protein
MQLLKEIAPSITQVAIMFNPDSAKAAKALGLVVPQSILLRADEVSRYVATALAVPAGRN